MFIGAAIVDLDLMEGEIRMLAENPSPERLVKPRLKVERTAVEGILNTLDFSSRIPKRELLTNVLLYLPRLADDKGQIACETAIDEIRRIEQMLVKRMSDYTSWLNPPSLTPELNQMYFESVQESEACIVLKVFHYLSSCRIHSNHFGLRLTGDSNPLAAMVTVSPFDLNHLIRHIPRGIDHQRIRVLSRVYAFPWAPANSISYMLARLCQELTHGTKAATDMLLTYVNPNLGFTAASYEASNWVLFARELPTRYVYIDGLYITDRMLIRQFGTADPDSLKKRLGDRIQSSNMRLEPLKIYAYFLDKHQRKLHHDAFDISVERPT